MSSGVILLQRPYISFSSPLLLILRREITAAAVALFFLKKRTPVKLEREVPSMPKTLEVDITWDRFCQMSDTYLRLELPIYSHKR